ncbi:hypothetical protein HLB44_18470 [Aquincola sp. S2]|uniref:Uncharacterized protein n=1 Tax=Pseudaquabacterium terrae TaxID=2732868 RepID=A0ABX2EK53_9BURK|nr:hypothetical protein [Aquabacterium terrae]NRF68983.1 hypothetical protein [Aquabacterium terrae]
MTTATFRLSTVSRIAAAAAAACVTLAVLHGVVSVAEPQRSRLAAAARPQATAAVASAPTAAPTLQPTLVAQRH